MSHPQAETLAGQEPSAEKRRGSRVKTVLKLAAVLLVIAGLFVLGRFAGPYVETFKDWVEGLGPLAPIVFILGYIVATVAFLPGAILTAAGGAIFGLLWGTVYVFIGATVGACLAFLISRYFARGWVEKQVQGKPKFEAIDRAVGREGGKIVALLRLTPVVPFNLLNYALGLTRVRFWPYALACFAMLPGTFLYVYLGYLAQQAASGAAAGEATLWKWVLRIVGLLATVAVTVLVTKRARKALAEQTEIDVDSSLEEETTDE
jgi:uncharacterized membrane protein YdjX (TVP38/TMEM64 family)